MRMEHCFAACVKKTSFVAIATGRNKTPVRIQMDPDRGCGNHRKENSMSMGTILLIVLVLLLVGALPTWPYSTGWGFYPSSGLGLLVIIVLVLLVMGRL
jgi:hypothetical protein